MGWLDRLRSGGAPRFDGTRGRPPSGNGASSFHLVWELPPGRYVEVSAELTVREAPTVPRLHFWALQVGFARRSTVGARSGGGAHLGLQWYPPHPGATAANWGGYRPGGGELDGGPLSVPSATANRNTGDWPWVAGRPYRLTVRRGDGSAPEGLVPWAGVIADVATGEEGVLRDLWADGDHLCDPMVWSEVFADCDAPPSEVGWRQLRARTDDGGEVAARRVRVNYQRIDEGGCATTDSRVEGDVLVQRTGTPRVTRAGSVLTVP